MSRKAENVAEYAANVHEISVGANFKATCKSLIAGNRHEAMKESMNSAKQNRASMKYRRVLES